MLRAVFAMAVGGAVLGSAGSSRSAEETDRPDPRVLRLTEEDLLGRFTPDVRNSVPLMGQALALWRTHFEAQADEVRRRFLSEEDWRPALADAAALIEEFLEASDLPRAGYQPAGEGQVWMERLDPKTGRRTRELKPAPSRPPIFAPEGRKDDKPGKAEEGQDAIRRTRDPVRRTPPRR